MLAKALAAAALVALAPAATPAKGGKEKPVTAATLRLEDLVFEKGEGERHRALRAWMVEHAQGWRHVPLHVGGNFITERWCAPAVPESRCASGSVVTSEERGAAWMTLETLHYDLPKAFGSVVSIGRFPEKGDLGLRFYRSIGGKTIVGEGLEATFLLLGAEKVEEAVSIGARQGLTVVTTDVAVDAPGGFADVLKRMAASPESLKAHARSMLDALGQRVEDALAKGEVMGFDEGEYKGGGIPPRRTPRPLTAAEITREREAAKKEIARRRTFVERHAAAMQALLVGSVPTDRL